MKILNDLQEIEQLAGEHAEANWIFRCKLIASNVPRKKIDTLAHELYEKVAPQIDCAKCGSCCRQISPLCDTKDITRYAQALGITEVQFEKKHLAFDEDLSSLIIKKSPCPFLSGTLCSLYEHRAHDCRTYPHINKPNIHRNLTVFYRNLAICPIIFNVWEGMKKALKKELAQVEYEWVP